MSGRPGALQKFTLHAPVVTVHSPAKRQGGGECPDQGPCEASVLASVFCELSTARSEHGAARRPLSGQLRQDPSPSGRLTVTAALQPEELQGNLSAHSTGV